jgi:hypothetical protein
MRIEDELGLVVLFREKLLGPPQTPSGLGNMQQLPE